MRSTLARSTTAMALGELSRAWGEAQVEGDEVDMATIEELEKRIEALEQKPARVLRVEEELIEAARQWARCTKLGYYEENGFCMRPNVRDLEELAKIFESKMRDCAASLLRMETL
jgi:hypothetical protein